jgi:hypothetical protein
VVGVSRTPPSVKQVSAPQRERPVGGREAPLRLAEKADGLEWRAANNILAVWVHFAGVQRPDLTVAARERFSSVLGGPRPQHDPPQDPQTQRRGPDPAVDSRSSAGSHGEQSRNVEETGMLPLYAARIEDLGPGDFVKVDCAACHHVALLTPEALLSEGSRPQRAAAVSGLREEGSGGGFGQVARAGRLAGYP